MRVRLHLYLYQFIPRASPTPAALVAWLPPCPPAQCGRAREAPARAARRRRQQPHQNLCKMTTQHGICDVYGAILVATLGKRRTPLACDRRMPEMLGMPAARILLMDAGEIGEDVGDAGRCRDGVFSRWGQTKHDVRSLWQGRGCRGCFGVQLSGLTCVRMHVCLSAFLHFLTAWFLSVGCVCCMSHVYYFV